MARKKETSWDGYRIGDIVKAYTYGDHPDGNVDSYFRIEAFTQSRIRVSWCRSWRYEAAKADGRDLNEVFFRYRWEYKTYWTTNPTKRALAERTNKAKPVFVLA